MKEVLRKLWPAALAIGIVLISLSVRATIEQRAAYARAVEFEKTGDLWRAVDEYRWCIRWYTPWGPDLDDAAQALVEIGERQSAQDPELAVQALDNLRSGLIAGRSLWQPRADLVAMCNQKLPPLLLRVADRRGDPRAIGPGMDKLLGQFVAAYQRPVGVGPLTSAAVSLGFILWLGGIVMAVRCGVSAEGKWLPAGWRWMGAAVLGFAVWAIAMAVG